jgi:hypothetical protein
MPGKIDQAFVDELLGGEQGCRRRVYTFAERPADYPGPTGRERPGEHWNARAIREMEAARCHADALRPQLEMHVRLALDTALEAQRENVSQFAQAVRTKGAVRATELHAKEAATLETEVSVWSRAVNAAEGSGDWLGALCITREYAVNQVRHFATARSRSRIDAALSAVQADAASRIIDKIDNLLGTAS